MNAKKHPGVYVPPPLIYVAFFFLSIILQKRWPINKDLLNTMTAHIAGWILIALCLIVLFTSLRRFVISRNTLVTIKPAASLQTTGIYAISRNPMYLSLLLLYSAIGIFKGNWWTFFMLPLLILTIQWFVIRKEEEYLRQAFGTSYKAYRQKVRRWV